MSEAADQCLGYDLYRPVLCGTWILNPVKAPIPTRHEVWDHKLVKLRVISTIEKTSDDRGIEWHLSISIGGKYPGAWGIAKVRNEFKAHEFELDDHGSRVAHLWLPVERDKRGDCDCNTAESGQEREG